MDRGAHRQGQFVDGRHAVVGIDKEPFPVERNDFDLDRLDVRGGRRNRLARIERVRRHPGHGAERQDDQARHGPDDGLDAVGMLEVGRIGRLGVRSTVLPGKGDRHDDDGDDRDQHQRDGEQDQVFFACGDRPLGVHHSHFTSGQKKAGGGHQAGRGGGPHAAMQHFRRGDSPRRLDRGGHVFRTVILMTHYWKPRVHKEVNALRPAGRPIFFVS